MKTTDIQKHRDTIKRPTDFTNETMAQIRAQIRAHNDTRLETMGDEQERADLIMSIVAVSILIGGTAAAIVAAFAWFILS